MNFLSLSPLDLYQGKAISNLSHALLQLVQNVVEQQEVGVHMILFLIFSLILLYIYLAHPLSRYIFLSF